MPKAYLRGPGLAEHLVHQARRAAEHQERGMDRFDAASRRHGHPVGKLSTRQIRVWRATLLSNGVSVSMAAKAYRLLRAILTTAVEDDKLLPVTRAGSAALGPRTRANDPC